jgi:AcrR family transcriptional regulator
MTRRYVSALRAELSEEVRNRILAALAEQLAAGAADFSLPQVAQRAGVSLRTIHNYFPGEEARIAALAKWIDDQVGYSPDEEPASFDDIGPYARRMALGFSRNEQLMRAQLAAGVATRVRRRRRAKREVQLRHVVASALTDSRNAELVAAMIGCVISVDIVVALRDRYGVKNEDVVRLIEWAAHVLAQAANRGDVPSNV